MLKVYRIGNSAPSLRARASPIIHMEFEYIQCRITFALRYKKQIWNDTIYLLLLSWFLWTSSSTAWRFWVCNSPLDGLLHRLIAEVTAVIVAETAAFLPLYVSGIDCS